MPEEDRTGDELTQELEDAWNLYTRVGSYVYSNRPHWVLFGLVLGHMR